MRPTRDGSSEASGSRRREGAGGKAAVPTEQDGEEGRERLGRTCFDTPPQNDFQLPITWPTSASSPLTKLSSFSTSNWSDGVEAGGVGWVSGGWLVEVEAVVEEAAAAEAAVDGVAGRVEANRASDADESIVSG